ncbi:MULTISPECIES: hypothetical protein [Kitasatospora]|uniref:Uncharacterized protein n=1 Tax=Kitasatospora setae (strain ATCC 33774 / DSM 43861 / JCM 3304 / KCC A-0304 / NBRC 14216 / KM-6054) TaxID=452652 RepID=E4N0I1_KITSK|nr:MULTISPECIES: hypothetical protein [Kitasatospora]BAJ31665.1 hypothetical protein KSE_58950 [Kitasatospora setae KM-6054]
MAAEGSDGPGGEPGEDGGVPPRGAPRVPPEGRERPFLHVAWIILAVLVLGLVLSTASGGCTAGCVSYP